MTKLFHVENSEFTQTFSENLTSWTAGWKLRIAQQGDSSRLHRKCGLVKFGKLPNPWRHWNQEMFAKRTWHFLKSNCYNWHKYIKYKYNLKWFLNIPVFSSPWGPYLGSNISLQKAPVKMIFLFQWWDMWSSPEGAQASLWGFSTRDPGSGPGSSLAWAHLKWGHFLEAFKSYPVSGKLS